MTLSIKHDKIELVDFKINSIVTYLKYLLVIIATVRSFYVKYKRKITVISKK